MRRLFLPLLVVVALPSLVEAHALGVEVLLKDGKLVISAFYDDDTNAAGAKVEIVDGMKLLAAGQTDRQGQCVLPLPTPGKYRVLVDAGAGHRAQRAFTVPENAASTKALAAALGVFDFCRAPENAERAMTAALPPVTEKKLDRSEAPPSGGKKNPSEAVKLSEGPGRAETTAYPWVKVAVGVGIIGVVALAFVASRLFRSGS